MHSSRLVPAVLFLLLSAAVLATAATATAQEYDDAPIELAQLGADGGWGSSGYTTYYTPYLGYPYTSPYSAYGYSAYSYSPAYGYVYPDSDLYTPTTWTSYYGYSYPRYQTYYRGYGYGSYYGSPWWAAYPSGYGYGYYYCP